MSGSQGGHLHGGHAARPGIVASVSPSPALLKAPMQKTSCHAAFSAPSRIFAVSHRLIFLRHFTRQARLQEILYFPKLEIEQDVWEGGPPAVSPFKFAVDPNWQRYSAASFAGLPVIDWPHC